MGFAADGSGGDRVRSPPLDIRKRNETPHNLGVEVGHRGREGQALSQSLGRFVQGEAGVGGGQLEQHPVVLAEVDREEVVAVDQAGDLGRARLGGPPAQGAQGIRRGAPGDMMDGPGAAQAASGRRVVDQEEALLAGPRRPPASVGRGEPEGTLQQVAPGVRFGSEGTHRAHAAQGVLGRRSAGRHVRGGALVGRSRLDR